MPDDTRPVEPYNALIFLPTINRKSGQNLADIARRFVTAFEQRAATAGASFRFDDQSPSATGVPNVTVCTIWRRDAPGERDHKILDLYFLDYRIQIARKYDDLSDVQRIFFLFMAIAGSFQRFLARPVHVYGNVRPRDWRFLVARLGGIAVLVVYLTMWVLWRLRGLLGDWATAAPPRWLASGWTYLPAVALVLLAALILMPSRPMTWGAWFQFAFSIAGLAFIGSIFSYRYGENLYDFLTGAHVAKPIHSWDLVSIVALGILALALIGVASLTFSDAGQPVGVRRHFQVLLGMLAMFNLVVYLVIVILAFFHTVRQQVDYWAKEPPLQAGAPAPATGAGAGTTGGEAKAAAPQGAARTEAARPSEVATRPNAQGAQPEPVLVPRLPSILLPSTLPQQVVILVTAVLFLMRPSWKAGVTTMGNTYLYFYYYLGYGRVRPEVVGQFRTLLEKICELTTVVNRKQDDGSEKQESVPLYDRVHVVGYSFGSLVAIDSLYPFNQEPPGRSAAIDGFVSIACPFDLIRTYFREYPQPNAATDPAYSYFDKRDALPDAPKRWLNIFSLSDVMSSNFRNDEKVDKPEVGINLRPEGLARRQRVPQAGPLMPQNVHFIGPFNAETTTWWDLLTLYGIRSHMGYWGDGSEVEVNCFDVVVPWLYQGHRYLA